MTRHLLLLSFGLFTLSTTTASARLGETWSNCIKFYGPCKRDPNGRPSRSEKLLPDAAQAEWEYHGFQIKVAWLPPGPHGPAAMMVVTSLFKFNEDQIAKLISLNSKGNIWKKTSETTWTRSDNSTAVLTDNGKRFVFKSAQLPP